MSRTRSELSAPQTGGRWRRLSPIDAGAARSGAWDAPSGEGEAHRCTCGSLLARLVAGGVELKCRRCKRIVVLPFHSERAR
ncbi:MAG TPA: hypothetical protein VFS67_35430 [Polyangiaceae bacterium]|nr:hypothetical protein [Polyangiaceae bacterium]